MVNVLKKLRERLTTSTTDLDAQKLRAFCATRTNCTPIGDLQPRQKAEVVGQITTVRIVPHVGSPWLEATLVDGTGTMVVMWTGRRRIPGITPGRRLALIGRAGKFGSRRRLVVYNPAYELL